MKTPRILSALLILGAGAALTGCGASRDVEVSGTVSAAQSASVSGPILLEFFDLTGEGDSLEQSSVHTANLASLGEFNETVSVEGDSIVVRAINDQNEDGVCSAGESWAELEAPIADDDSVEPLSLILNRQPCP